MEIGKEGIGTLESVDKMPTMGNLDMSLLLVPDTFEPLERGPEEALIEALNRAIIDGGFYKNALEMVDLPRRYVEESPQFEQMFEKDEFVRTMNSSPVISELLDKVYVRK